MNGRLVCAAMLVSVMSTAYAKDLPLWELGAGAAAISFPDYRGSNQQRTYLLPVPYVVYRGEFLQIDRQQGRGVLFNNGQIELDISFDGAVPVSSKDNTLRQGMPDLPPTVEFGPSAKIWIARSERNDISVRLPVRPVISVDSSKLQQVGWVAQPQLNVNFKNFQKTGWNLGFVSGLMFADQRYHQFFYGVETNYATATRPSYQAHGGYSGVQLLASLSKRYTNHWLGAYLKYDALQDTAFEHSPLLAQRYAFTFGVSAVWIFQESKTKVAR